MTLKTFGSKAPTGAFLSGLYLDGREGREGEEEKEKGMKSEEGRERRVCLIYAFKFLTAQMALRVNYAVDET
jgi:hypothetical protein